MAQVIGQAIDRIDGRAKVTGTAAYAADNRAERMAFGSIVTATIARGRVAGIDANAARRMPGVLLVMTHENAPRQAPFQAKAEDRHARPKPQLASDKVEYFGQPVALVVAETAEAARAAASAVVVTYEKADGVFVLESASGAAYNPGKGPTGAPSDSTLGESTEDQKTATFTITRAALVQALSRIPITSTDVTAAMTKIAGKSHQP